MSRFQADVYREVALMRQYFPSFKCRLKRETVIWHGPLQPTESSTCYRIRITYARGSYPKVRIIQPGIRPDAPHRYSDRSLCLFYPEEETDLLRQGIAKTIVPWAAEWLLYYEAWLVTGVWYGPEAPHPVVKAPDST